VAFCDAMSTRIAWLRFISVLLLLVQDAVRFLLLGTRSSAALKAENLFLRKQLALYLERKAKPRRAQDATRLTLALLSRLFAWKEALVIVRPETLIRWHRKGFQLFWRCKSKPRGRPRVPADLRELITEMARSNPTRGEERIAAELLLKLGIRLSPRTVRRYMPEDRGSGNGLSSQRWTTLFGTMPRPFSLATSS
jgi:putative transposase